MSTAGDRSSAAEAAASRSFLLVIYLNAFITGAVVMGFEMLGSRYLNPYFGSGIYTWAALISTVLAALTAGYFFGGWMADRRPQPSGLGWLIVAGSAYLAVIPLFADPMLELLTALLGDIKDQREFERWGSIVGAMLLLFVPLALLGVYSPYAIRLTLRATSRSGTVAGRIYGISTLGSIFGTLFVTFYLIPSMGSRHITYLLAAIGALAGLSFLLMKPAALRRVAGATAALLLAALALPQTGYAEEGREGVTLVQASPDAKEAAERFIGYLKKQGFEVRHGDIEKAEPQGFRIKDLALTGPDKTQLKAAAFQAASFELKTDGEASLASAVATDIEIAAPDKSTGKIARLAAENLTWSTKKSVSLKGLELRDAAITQPTGQTMKVATVAAALARFDGAGSGALEKFAVRGITVTGGPEGGSLGSIDVESLVVDMPKRIAVKGLAIRDVVADTREQGKVRMAAIELREFEALNMMDRNPAELKAFNFALKGLEAPLNGSKDPEFERNMRELGYTAVKMNAELVYRYDLADKSFNLAKLEIDVAEMGAVSLGFKIAGLSPDDIRQAMNPPPGTPPGNAQAAGAMALLARLNLISADIVYTDKSIIGRVLKREAERNKTDEASIRAQYRALLVGFRDQQTDPLAKEAIDAVIAFLENPGQLVIEVRPPSPMNLIAVGSMAMASPAQLRALLGIKVTAKKP
ncbi:MAG: fused MFS/spermidine synthase [Rhodospirillaceae bacterium]|nr:fused MFS/spermidine synthase [Rhodospirillaceae bacterium]